MMATTHALAGLLLGGIAATAAPDLAGPALSAGLVGGAAPDLDLYAGHRRTLHFPVYGPLAGALAVVVAVLASSAATVAGAAFLSAAGLHALSDVAGGGLELRPWRGESDRAVYDHYRGRWIRPRRWVRYDGAPEDALLAGLLAVPTLAVVDPLPGHAWLGPLVVAVVAGSVAYAALRRRIPAITERTVGLLPSSAHPYVPDRFLEGQRRADG
jgi:hypothetical protein